MESQGRSRAACMTGGAGVNTRRGRTCTPARNTDKTQVTGAHSAERATLVLTFTERRANRDFYLKKRGEGPPPQVENPEGKCRCSVAEPTPAWRAGPRASRRSLAANAERWWATWSGKAWRTDGTSRLRRLG